VQQAFRTEITQKTYIGALTFVDASVRVSAMRQAAVTRLPIADLLLGPITWRPTRRREHPLYSGTGHGCAKSPNVCRGSTPAGGNIRHQSPVRSVKINHIEPDDTVFRGTYVWSPRGGASCAIGRVRPRVCQNTKAEGFEGSRYPSRHATRPL
jgi:hypothetical protein